MLFQDRHCDGGSKRARASVCLQAFISAVPRGCVNVHTSLTNAADLAATGQPFRGCDRLRTGRQLSKGTTKERERERIRENEREKLLIIFL